MKVLASILALLLPSIALGQNLDIEQIQRLSIIQQRLESVHDFRKRDMITEAQQVQLTTAYIHEAREISPDITEDELPSFISHQKSLGLRVYGLFTFINVLWVVAALLFVVASAWLSWLYLFWIITNMPVVVYEIALYAGTIFALFNNWYWALAGAFAIPACIQLTAYLHLPDWRRIRLGVDNFIEMNSVITLICFAVWTFFAVHYVSYFFAFISIMALMQFLGFTVVVCPGCVFTGYESEDYIPRTMVSAFVIMVFGVAVRIAERIATIHESVLIFIPGAIFVGSFVYFISLLITSSKWYTKKPLDKKDYGENYWIMQAISVASGIAAMYIGSVYSISALQGISGVVFVVWAVEKYYEWRWKKLSMAWNLLGLSGFIYAIAWIANKYPQYFLFMG